MYGVLSQMPYPSFHRTGLKARPAGEFKRLGVAGMITYFRIIKELEHLYGLIRVFPVIF